MRRTPPAAEPEQGEPPQRLPPPSTPSAWSIATSSARYCWNAISGLWGPVRAVRRVLAGVRNMATASSTVVASLGGLVVAPAAGEAREPHRQAGVLLEQAPAGGVVGERVSSAASTSTTRVGSNHTSAAQRESTRAGRSARTSGARRAGRAASSASVKPVPHLQIVWNRSPAGS